MFTFKRVQPFYATPRFIPVALIAAVMMVYGFAVAMSYGQATLEQGLTAVAGPAMNAVNPGEAASDELPTAEAITVTASSEAMTNGIRTAATIDVVDTIPAISALDAGDLMPTAAAIEVVDTYESHEQKVITVAPIEVSAEADGSPECVHDLVLEGGAAPAPGTELCANTVRRAGARAPKTIPIM